MASELQDLLQNALGTTYTLHRELGGGGMSRVFVAEDTALGRTVVVKVLPAELAADVSVERFNREILLAAKLQHPHIVPVLHAGELAGLPYFTMPFVDGESLRARLARGPLAIGEAVGVLRDVAKALAFAHERGVVHRDIKPDNIMLTGGSAVVADFGIAKALVASRARQDLGGTRAPTLTQLGTSIGTPAYMAPEQAAGDPDTDHRADLYALGCVGYELLTGRSPFQGRSPQALLAAHMGETPAPVAGVRPDTPPLLADVITRCLAKDPADRPQQASDIARMLESVTSGTAHDAMPASLLGGAGDTRKALALWGVATLVVVLAARVATTEIGLPSWVLPGAVGVMLLGLPVILFTAYVHRAARRELRRTPTLTPGGTVRRTSVGTFAMKASPHVSWRRTALGGGAAITLFLLVTAAFLVSRSTGIGPFGSLLAMGRISEREPVLVAEFSGDTALGPVLAEAARTGLSQSSVLTLMHPTAVTAALRRMEREPATRVDAELARELARREGIKAFVIGDVRPLGSGYVVTMQLVGADSGQNLVSLQETSPTAEGLIKTVGTLTTQLRERVGESLRAVRRSRGLEQVTTGSLAALERYTAGTRTLTEGGNFQRGAQLLEDAIRLDTGFAMAYRRLAIEMQNQLGPTARSNALLEAAFRHRNRLTDVERYLTEGSYYTSGAHRDPARALAAYENLLAVRPDHFAALNNAALIHGTLRNDAQAEALYRRAIAANPLAGSVYSNLAITLYRRGKRAEAARWIDSLAVVSPDHPNVLYYRAGLQANDGNLDSAARLVDRLRTDRIADPALRGRAIDALRAIAETRGRFDEARRWTAELAVADSMLGRRSSRLTEQVDLAFQEALGLAQPARAAARLDSALARYPLASIPATDQPLFSLGFAYGLAGRPDRARAMLTLLEAREGTGQGAGFETQPAMLRGTIAFAERRYDAAVREFRAADVGECITCALPMLGLAYDNAGNRDSAIAVLQRYVDLPSLARFSFVDPTFLAATHKRLGELYDERGGAGDRERAATHFARFVGLRRTADPALQREVREAEARLARLERAVR